MQNLPAGLLNDQIEFFAGPDLRGYCLTSGRVLAFENFGEDTIARVEAHMKLFPLKLEGIKLMGVTGRLDIIRQYLVCNYGGFDNAADMVNGQLLATEFWPCPNRGNCDFEGIVCDGLKGLTEREIQVTRLIADGHVDKEIAIALNISLHTVTTHTRNIRNKTGLLRKPDITRFAHQNFLTA